MTSTGRRRATWSALHKPRKLDKSGKTYELLRDNFHRVAMVDGIVDLRAQLSGRLGQTGDPARCARSSVSISIHSAARVVVAARPAPARRSSARPRRRSSSRRRRRPRAPRRSAGRTRARARAPAPPARVARHRRPGAAIVDLDGDAVVGAAALEQRQRVLEVAGDARADVERGPRLARHGVHRVAAGDRRHHRRHLRPAVGERLDAERSRWASALTALRPRCGVRPRVRGHARQLASSATARPCAPRPGRRSRGRTRRPGPPSRPRRGPRRRDRAAASPRRRRRSGAAPEGTAVARTPPSPSPPAPGRPSCRRRRGRSSASPSRRNGRSATVPEREDGVGVAEQRDHRPRRRRAERSDQLRAG